MPSISTSIAVIGTALAVVYMVLQWHLHATQDPREPPVIENALPYITPALGLSKHTYFRDLR